MVIFFKKMFGKRMFILSLLTGVLFCNWNLLCAQSIESAMTVTVQKSTNPDNNSAALIFIVFPIRGWYMVSLPVTVADSAVSTLFPMSLGAFFWETDHYEAATVMKKGCGYWLVIPESSMVMISGEPLTQFSGHYQQGWHLVGSLLDSVNFTDPQDNPDGSVLLPLFNWQYAAQRYDTSLVIQQSYGYWMAVFEECDLTIQSGAKTVLSKPIANQAKAAFYEKFVSIPPPPFQLDSRWEELLPAHQELSGNYPNPFNSATMIQYRVPQPGLTFLTVHNVLGQKIRTLVSGQQLPGVHKIPWDGNTDNGTAAVSGVYFYRIIANNFSETRKMILIR